MPNKTADRLQRNIDKILTRWEKRVLEEVAAAHHQKKLALRNSLPDYLKQVVNALSNTIDRTSARQQTDKLESSRTGKKHGEDRAGSKNYTMDQLITEYHILRQVLFDVMEEEGPLTEVEREVIVCSIEQAVNDAATEYSEIMKSVKERISKTLAHDLRNPITSTKISAELVLRKLSSTDPFAPKMNLIINNMNRLEQMIVELLDASRLEAGESMPVVAELCDLSSIIRQAISEISLSDPAAIKIQTPDICEGYWDESGLRRITENLVSNAIKYGDSKKPISITLTDEGDSVDLCVHNFGNPIAQADIPILFEQYKRLKSSEKQVGWGLGLTMVKGMVEAHHGTITVESDVGRGTTFRIQLPRDARKNAALEKPHHIEQAPQVPKTDRHAQSH